MIAFAQGPTWHAGRISGVPIRLHWSLGLMVGIQLLQALFAGPRFLVYVIPIEALVVASILFHEMSHSLVARSYGMRTLGITLHAFGGFAQMAGEPSNKQQVAISAAGPLSNLLLWLCFSGLVQVGAPFVATVASGVAGFNLMIALFNLIPAYPMDGGSVLLHFLRMKAPHAQASWLAFKVGVVVSVPLAILGLITNDLLLALFFFLTYQACQERLVSVGVVGGWEYWKARLFRSRPRKGTPLDVDWQKYAPPGTTVNQTPEDWPPKGRPDDRPPSIN